MCRSSWAPDPRTALRSPFFGCSSQAGPLRTDSTPQSPFSVILEATCWYLGAKVSSLKLLATLGNCQQAQQMVKDWGGESKPTLHLWTPKNRMADYFFISFADALAIWTDRHVCFNFKSRWHWWQLRRPWKMQSLLKAKPWFEDFSEFLCCKIQNLWLLCSLFLLWFS